MANSDSFEGFVLDSSKCSGLSMEEKRELVYEVSKWARGGPELLQSWSRQEILQILCAEMGKERKYTGLTKIKIIENLLKVVSEKAAQEVQAPNYSVQEAAASAGEQVAKRQRKTEHPTRLTIASDSDLINVLDNTTSNAMYCKNSACRAKLSQEDAFCKRCSCCICFQYDDNKDPSLWLTCNSEFPFVGNSCGMSCHLECAVRHEKSGIPIDGPTRGLDGCFYCMSCRKINDLLGCWRKQMMIARDTRRVDILCYRVSLGQKLLKGSSRYQRLNEFVDNAVQRLEEEVGPLTGLPVKKARGIVNRLSSGQEVQKLCASALHSLDLILSSSSFHKSSEALVKGSNASTLIVRFENVGPDSLSVIVGPADSSSKNITEFKIWHRRKDDVNYPSEPTCTVVAPRTSFSLSGLTSSTPYLLKVVSFENSMETGTTEVEFKTSNDTKEVPNSRTSSPTTNFSSISNPSSVEDESNSIIPYRNESEKHDKSNAILTGDPTDVIICSGNGQGGAEGKSLLILDNKLRTTSLPKANYLPGPNAVDAAKNFPGGAVIEDITTENESSAPLVSDKECRPASHNAGAALPVTPCKMENFKGVLGKNVRPKLRSKDLVSGLGTEVEQLDGSSSKKRYREREEEECSENGDRDFGYYVKVIRWLECNGHLETEFRQKFLTWYSLRASAQEVRILKVFVDTLMEDPPSLAGQLVDTFSEVISNKRCSAVPAGFCLKLWH